MNSVTSYWKQAGKDRGQAIEQQSAPRRATAPTALVHFSTHPALNNPNLAPGLTNCILLVAPRAVELPGYSGGKAGELLELHFRRKAGITKCLVPNPTSLLPRMTTNCRGCEIKCAVRNPGVDMYAPVVLPCVYEVFHIRGLWVLAEHRVVIGCSRR